EIGCGTGLNLLKFVELGFNPKNIIGNELLHDRALDAKKNVPKEIKILEGNALDLDLPNDFFDIVFQSTVFSSILNINFRKELSLKLWQLVKPGGGILWYDFTYNNPSNKDVSGIKLKVLKQLFPEGKMKFWRLTLAPPIGRLVVKIHPSLYTFFNIFPFLKTHVLCWIEKKE
ncbi:MAG: class I SAM-dependent methyltransferase, partial [Ignavibacteriaceae bacterium]|nr:class I SAM-dependent methyltransferase [Ignavibacteriaceae bacterium]